MYKNWDIRKIILQLKLCVCQEKIDYRKEYPIIGALGF